MAFTVPETRLLDKPILSALTSVASTAIHDVGYTSTTIDGREFVYSFLSTNMTAVSIAGYPAFFLAGGSASDVGHVVTTTHQGDNGRSFAGVLVAASIGGGSNFVWVQRSGYLSSTAVSSVVAAGDTLTVSEAGMLSTFRTSVASTSLSELTYTEINVPVVGVAKEIDASGLADVILFKL